MNDLYEEVKEVLGQISTIWLYEKRAGWETVFLYNINRNDMITKPQLNMLNEPSIWIPKF